jgi:hypothetical protein
MKKVDVAAGEEMQQDCGMSREKRRNLKGLAADVIGG